MMPSQQIGDITNIYMLRLQVKQSVHPFFMPLHLPPHNRGDTIRYTNTYKCDVEVVPPSMGPYGRQLPLGRHPSKFIHSWDPAIMGWVPRGSTHP